MMTHALRHRALFDLLHQSSLTRHVFCHRDIAQDDDVDPDTARQFLRSADRSWDWPHLGIH